MVKNRLIFWALLLLAASMGGLFVWKWDVGFSSDQALIGLMGLRHYLGGPEEIYVWGVGYQGILLEVHLLKWVFQLFGVSGLTLTLGPFLCFLAMITAFHGAVSRSFTGARAQAVAHWSTLFLLVSTPFFYERVIRTQPNYVETYFFGFCLFILYFEILRNSQLWKWLLFGFLAGFAIYTYEQIYYFLGALGAHAAWNRWKVALDTAKPEAFSPLGRQLLKNLFLALFVIGLYFFFTLNKGSLIELTLLGKKIKIKPVSLFQLAGAGILLTFYRNSLFIFIKGLVREVRTHLLPLGAAAFMGVIGLSPKLYYRHILKGFEPYDHHVFRGEWSSMRVNADVLKEAVTQYLNFDYPRFSGHLGQSLFIGWFLLIAIGIWVKGVTLARSNAHDKKPAFDWLLFFALPVTGLFLVSGSVTDFDHIRYYLPILFPIAVLLGFATQVIWEFCAQKHLRAYLLVPAYVLGQIHFHSFSQELKISNHAAPWRTLIAELDRRGIDRAYGNYWFGYSTTFLTGERIQVEPCFSNYAPHYGREVAGATRIAVIDFKNAQGRPDTCGVRFISSGKAIELEIRGQTYSLESEFAVNFSSATIRQDRTVEARAKREPVHVWILKRIE